ADAEPGAQLVEHHGAGMHLAALDARDHRPADAGARRNLLQRQPQAGPPLRDAAADETGQRAFDGIHYKRMASLMMESSLQHFLALPVWLLPSGGSSGIFDGSRTTLWWLVKFTLIVVLVAALPAGNGGARIAVNILIHSPVSCLNRLSP